MERQSIFIDPTAFLSGSLRLGDENYIGPYARVNAGEGFYIQLSRQDNLQDHVTVSAAASNVSIGERTSIAHGAEIINSRIGSFVFVGFNAQVEDAVLEDGVMVQHGARVSGVTIPADRIVPPGAVIESPDQVSLLPIVAESHRTFKEEVVEVNTEFAFQYAQMVKDLGETNVRGICPNPRTTWNPGFAVPFLAKDVRLAPDVRLIGDIRLGEKSSIGPRTSIRGDEGAPIIVGSGARIGHQVTFHALKDQSIEIGGRLVAGNRVILHGSLTIGDMVSVGDRCVLFRSTLGNQITIGKGAIIVGVRLADGARVPDGALVLDQASADQFAA